MFKGNKKFRFNVLNAMKCT